MTRRLINLLVILAVVLFAAIAAAWVRSYAPRDFTLGAHDGSVLLLFTDGQWTTYARPQERYSISFGDLWKMGQGQGTGSGSFLGVEYVTRATGTGPGTGGNAGRFLMVAVPFAYPAALAAAAAAWALLSRSRLARRTRQGACRQCGYDLTGNVSGVCPECGRAAAARTAQP